MNKKHQPKQTPQNMHRVIPKQDAIRPELLLPMFHAEMHLPIKLLFQCDEVVSLNADEHDQNMSQRRRGLYHVQ